MNRFGPGRVSGKVKNTVKLAGMILLLVAGGQAYGQTWDTSGNALLRGTSYFRDVIWLVGDNSGGLGRAIAVYGAISFDGNGNYSISGAQVFDSNAGAVQSLSKTGTYSISASGYGFMSHPLSTGDSIHGLVSRGIFIGSSTKSSFNDLFISAPLASPLPTNASFQGTYTLVQLDFPDGNPLNTRDSQFQLRPDGNGNIGTVTATGHIAGRGTTAITQNIAGVRYFFSNGGANVSFAGSLSNSNLIAGTKYLYLSADGDFVFGGSPTGFDMIAGVRSPSASPSFNGLYYQAGVFQDESGLGQGFGDLNTYYGSFTANSGSILAHQRLLSVFNNNPLDAVYSDSFTLKGDGTYDDSTDHFVFGAGGAIRIGIGNNVFPGISVAVQAPGFTPSGVFIDPTGIVNAASSALFTSGVAPGELITIYGSNLAPSLKVDASFPTQLNGVQVLVNGRPAPVYFVSANQISAVIPFGTTELIAAIQVINGGVASNTVTSYVNLTAPGVFTQPPGGMGGAAALHGDNSVVTAANPAHVGETISLYVTGLGAVTPAVADAAPGPVNPLSTTTNPISVYVGGRQATVSFTGLAPQLVGLYQINLQVPAGVPSGNAPVQIVGPDFYTTQATVPVG